MALTLHTYNICHIPLALNRRSACRARDNELCFVCHLCQRHGKFCASQLCSACVWKVRLSFESKLFNYFDGCPSNMWLYLFDTVIWQAWSEIFDDNFDDWECFRSNYMRTVCVPPGIEYGCFSIPLDSSGIRTICSLHGIDWNYSVSNIICDWITTNKGIIWNFSCKTVVNNEILHLPHRFEDSVLAYVCSAWASFQYFAWKHSRFGWKLLDCRRHCWYTLFVVFLELFIYWWWCQRWKGSLSTILQWTINHKGISYTPKIANWHYCIYCILPNKHCEIIITLAIFEPFHFIICYMWNYAQYLIHNKHTWDVIWCNNGLTELSCRDLCVISSIAIKQTITGYILTLETRSQHLTIAYILLELIDLDWFELFLVINNRNTGKRIFKLTFCNAVSSIISKQLIWYFLIQVQSTYHPEHSNTVTKTICS